MIAGLSGNKSLIVVLLAAFCCIFITLPVIAGQGDGTGGEKGIPLSLTNSDPVNGEKNVAVTTDIKLTFNKNVVNLAVRDNNIKCFSLSINGINVPIQVNMPDDQVDFEHRDDITVKPGQHLEPGTEYKLVISGQLKAKNGISLGTPVTISFTTVGVSSSSQNSNQPDSAGQDTKNTKTGNNIKPNTAACAPSYTTEETNSNDGNKSQEASMDTKTNVGEKIEEKSMAISNPQANKDTESGNKWVIFFAVGLIIIAAGCYEYYKYSQKK